MSQPTRTNHPTIAEAAMRVELPEKVLQVAREYAESGKVSPGRIAEILGDPNRVVTMKSSDEVDSLCVFS